jgi:hypothetical protein
MAKKILIRIFVMILLFFVLNFLYNILFFERDMDKLCYQALDIRKSQDTTDIYYFAESSNFTARDNDSTKKSISELTGLFFPSLRVTAVNKEASHAGVYRHWLSQIDVKKHPPKAIVVTLNLRSFDAAWRHSKLETALQQSVILLKPYPHLFNRFLLSLGAFDNKTEQQREKMMLDEWKQTQLEFPFSFKYKTVREWDDAMAQGGHLKPDGSWDMDKITLACHYIKGYAFNIHDDNARVKDFDFISNWCKKNDIRLYLNLMAENMQYADSLVGKELTYLMRSNRDYLVKRYSNDNCTVVDNLELVGGKEYIDQAWTTEHYAYRGRMIIAKHLAGALQKQFPAQYKAVY